MESFGTTRLLRTAGILALSLLAASVLLKPASSLAQTLPASPNRAQPIDPNDPNVLKPTDQDAGLLSQQGGKRLMDEADKAVTRSKLSHGDQKASGSPSGFQPAF